MALSAVVALSGCGSVDIAVPAESQPLSGVRVAFDSFTAVNYEKNRSLHGWRTTRTAVNTTLKLWYDRLDVRQTVEDGTPAELKTFLRDLPGPEDCDISVVYLGSNQNVRADWEFVNGEFVNWRDLLAAATPPAHPCRIVILDACHAAAVRHIPAWAERLATVTLLASDAGELTYDFAPSALTPIDVKKHLPSAWGWAHTHLPPEWNKRVSYLGLMWIQAAAQVRTPPAEAAGWMRFFAACEENAADFRRTVSRRWGSTVETYTLPKIR